MSTKRTYPYKAWILMPSFKPAEVELVRHSGSVVYDGDYTEKGKYYRRSDQFGTKAAAIEEGWKRVERQEENLRKSAETLEKKRVALLKAGREEMEAAAHA